MNQINRYCTYQGHEGLQVNQICTYKRCNLNRWCCQECLPIHRHKMPNQNYILNQAQLSDKVKQDIANLKKKYLGSQSNNVIQDDDNFKLQQLINQVEGKNFIQLNDDDIYELLNINQYQFNYDSKEQQLDPLDQMKNKLSNRAQEEKQFQEKVKEKIIGFKSRKYDIQKIHEVKDYTNFIISSLISQNQQYLVYNVRKSIQIYDIKMNKTYKSIQQNHTLSSFQFTLNSKNLFAGDQQGFVYGYFVQRGFKRFYKLKIHKYEITQIIIQEYYLITASQDKTIIKTDLSNKEMIFKLVGHQKNIYSIDYNFYKDIIISLSNDNVIKIWDCLSQNILITYVSKKDSFNEIQLINNQQDILCSDDFGIKQFAIDYQNKKLVNTFTYRDDNRILGFQKVNNDHNLLLICGKYLKILNNQGELIHQTQHDLYLKSTQIKTYRQQLNNLSLIILQDEFKLHLLRVKHRK